MSNKKQNSVDWLISCITEDQMVKAKSLNEWLEIFEQAKAMEKEQIINARQSGIDATINGKSISNIDYYNETFGGEE